jgi:hypothetical protein
MLEVEMSEKEANKKEEANENDEAWQKRLLLFVMTMLIALISLQ